MGRRDEEDEVAIKLNIEGESRKLAQYFRGLSTKSPWHCKVDKGHTYYVLVLVIHSKHFNPPYLACYKRGLKTTTPPFCNR